MKKKKWYLRGEFLSLVGALVLVFLFLIVSTRVGVHFFADPQIEQIRIMDERYKPLVFRDLEALTEQPLFGEITYNKNAQELLGQYLIFDGANGPVKPLDSDAQRLHDLWVKYTTGWARQMDKLNELEKDVDARKLITDWVGELSRYDHWKMSAAPEIREILEKANEANSLSKIALSASYPYPKMGELSLATAIYVLKAKDKMKAMKVYRHVGQLFHSHRSLIGNMIAVSHLQGEATLKEKFELTHWELPDAELLKTYKRLSWGWMAAFDLIFREFDNRFRDYLDPRNGMCAAVRERLAYIGGASDFFENSWPFEINYKQEIRAGRKVMAEMLEICHMQEWKAFNEPTMPGKNPVFVDKDLGFQWENLLGVDIHVNPSAIPYLRGAIGMIIMTIATPNPYSQYEKMNNDIEG